MRESFQRYKDFSPTPFDSKGLGIHDEQENWFIAPCAINRDSGALSLSNWSALIAGLQEVNDGEDWTIHRFGHWANGWFEIILVKPDSKSYEFCLEVAARLEDYPILNEEDLSEREFFEACDSWDLTPLKERVAICQRHGINVFAARHNIIPQGLPYYDDFYRPNE